MGSIPVSLEGGRSPVLEPCTVLEQKQLESAALLPALLPADFGFAQHMSPWDEKHVLRGSPLYMAPEMVCQRQYDARVDLWSVGVILYGESSVPLPPPGGLHCVLRQGLSGALLKGFNEKVDFPGLGPPF